MFRYNDDLCILTWFSVLGIALYNPTGNCFSCACFLNILQQIPVGGGSCLRFSDFILSQGLPVFNDPSAPSNISFNDCHFGTKCFQRVTKAKSRMVLQILKLGYNVLLSDVDVYWFKNPLPSLYTYGPFVLAAQSDEYKATGDLPIYPLLTLFKIWPEYVQWKDWIIRISD